MKKLYLGCALTALVLLWGSHLTRVTYGQEPSTDAPATETAEPATETQTETATEAVTEVAEPATEKPAEPSGGVEGIAEEAEAPPALDTGDNAWMLTSCALVLFMTAPGLAMFYGGLVRKKNVVGVIMQCVFLMGLMTVLWALYGFSLAFGSGSPWIGNGDYLFMKGVAVSELNSDGTPNFPMQGTIPRSTFMLFQGMFFIITPALICGAFAERMKFSSMVVFSILWGTIVYCPLAHWVWGGGVLAYGGEHSFSGGALDFAGGTVVHISSGVSALICALMIGKRVGFGKEPMPPHNLTFTALGAAMLWVGWFGFNAGSAGAANALASSAFMATQFSAAAGALGWAVLEWFHRGKPSLLGAASGAVAGLVCITPAAGYVQPMPALIMGVAAGVVCCLACTTLKNKLGYDDSLDAFGVHGIGGTLGAVLTGVFATNLVYPVDAGKLGLLEGGTLMTGQIVATAITWGFAIVLTFIILKVIDVTMGLRVSVEEELSGLDITQHGEEGYIFN